MLGVSGSSDLGFIISITHSCPENALSAGYPLPGLTPGIPVNVPAALVTNQGYFLPLLEVARAAY